MHKLMGEAMYYEALTPSDLANTTALNEEFLRIAAAGPGLGALEKAIAALTPVQRSWLARTPILLYSIRERDLDRWAHLDKLHRSPDLFGRNSKAEQPVVQFTAVAAAFAWQLAQTKPYQLRLLFNASADWINLIASARYLDVVEFARASPELLSLREQHDRAFWERLLGAGVSAEPEVRRAARLSALQYMYTRPSTVDQDNSWPVAACAAVKPRLRVADAPNSKRRRRNS